MRAALSRVVCRRDRRASARAINSSLEAHVAERTAVLRATRDRLSELAAQLTADYFRPALGRRAHRQDRGDPRRPSPRVAARLVLDGVVSYLRDDWGMLPTDAARRGRA